TFGRERLAKRAEIVGEKPSVPPLTPFTSAEPGFLTSSQPTSRVRVKEIKPPPNQHAPTYGVLATSQIPKGALVLEYRCALSDAHAYMSNKAHQYALLGTGTKYVRLVPAPLDICLDARVMGNEGRFVRWDEDEEETRFGIFALRELELGEEIVLGWEWSVEHVVHKLVRDPKLGPLPEGDDVLNDSDTRRLWDILDLLRSLSLTCACKPDLSTCALSFGRMLVEDTDAVGHASDLGPLVGHKRYENGFEPSMHAVSTKTRRGRKSAGRDRKARQATARPISPIPKVPSPPPVIPIPEPKPEPVPAAVPPRDPTPPLPPPVTTPAKRAIGKLSIASSPLSELSDVGDEHVDEISPDHAPKRHRGATSARAKHKWRIESPTPEEDTGARPGPAGDAPPKSVEVEPGAEPDGAGITNGAHEPVPPPNQGNEEDTRKAVVLQDEVAIKVESEDLWQGAGVNEPHADEATAVIEAAEADIEADTPDAFAPHVDIAHDPESDHFEAPKKVSFLDWARRRRATQVTETKDLLPASTDEAGTPAPEPPASTEVDSIPSNPPSLSPTAPTLPASNANSTEHPPSPPQPLPIVQTVVSRQTSPTPSTIFTRPITPPPDATIHDPPMPAPDVTMADPLAINGKFPIAPHETSDPGAGAFPFSPSTHTPPRQSSPTPTAQLPLLDAMDVDPVDPVATITDRGENRASPFPFAHGPSCQPSTSHTPTNPSPPPEQPSSSPGVLPALTKRLSHLGVEQPKAKQDTLDSSTGNSHSSSAGTCPAVPRAPRSFGDAPEEGEITLASRALPTSDNGSPAVTPAPLPSGPRERQPPTQPRRFSADPPPSVSPSGSASARPNTLAYPRLPPSGPSRGVSSSPRAPPSAPRAERRGYPGPSPPTGPRERERERERERDRDRDRDRDVRGRGRGLGGIVPRGPSAERNWRGRGRGLPSRGAWRQ
ncbi:hypothetical protein FRC06_002788, partial [Ceratobasidium sp. 370]